MKKDKAAGVYARTLMDAALAAGSNDAVLADMRALAETFRRLPALHKFLTHPIRHTEDKAKLMANTVGQMAPLTVKFFKLLEHKARFALLRGIADEYLTLEEERKNILRATIVSAQPLSQEQMDKLARGLEAQRPGKKFLLENTIDANLLAGFRIVQGDQITDASLRHKLELLKQKLAA